MPRQCSICSNPLVSAINDELRAGDSPTNVSHNHGVSRDSVSRHWKNGHASGGKVIPMAAPAALSSKDLNVRLHGLLAAADQEVRRAEREGGSMHHLRSLRGYRATLRQSVAKPAVGARAVSKAQHEALEGSWKRAVDALGAVSTPSARLIALEGCREALGELFKAAPRPGAIRTRLQLAGPSGEPWGESPEFWLPADSPLARGENIELTWPVGDLNP